MPAILDSSGSPMQQAPTQEPVRYMMRDGLGAALSSVGGGWQQGYGAYGSGLMRQFTSQLAVSAYLASGLLRKVIDIPAADRVREWRDWQADAEQIAALEAEERRLCIVDRVRFVEVLRGLGGGALILALPGDPETPVVGVSPGSLAAVNVASRWQLQLVNIDRNMASPTYGQPAMFRINAGGAGQQDIHPSRVIPFRCDPVPEGFGVTSDDAYWGASRLERVMREVSRSDNAADWFAALVKKAKLLRFGVSGLENYDQADLDRRVALIAQGENLLNASIYQLPVQSGSGASAISVGGEKIDDYQVNWSGIPAMMDAFDQRVAAVADIPFTRLMGRSPAGMNATGEHDMDNWDRAVSSGQKLELRPCLEMLDAVLIPSAGVEPDGVTWRFAPLSVPSEKDEADTFDTVMDAMGKAQGLGVIPDIAFAKGAQNLLSEREWIPGLDQALSELPEDVRFGVIETRDPANDDDPSAFTQSGGGTEPGNGGKEVDQTSPTTAGGMEVSARRRAANDAKPIPLYVQRKLLNADDLIAWAKKLGFKTTLPADDMHVTVLYSRMPVDPIAMGSTYSDNEKGEIAIKPGGPRAVEKLGESAVVLLFASDDLSWRHRGMVEAGASHDFSDYQPHVTITYDAGDVNLDVIRPYTGPLRFGPELFEPLNEDWKSGLTETE